MKKHLYTHLFIAACISFSSCGVNKYNAINTYLNDPACTTDPVCEKDVCINDTSSNLMASNYNNQTYYFDTKECQKVFLNNPKKFVRSSDLYDKKFETMGYMIGGVVMISIVTLMLFSFYK